MLLGYVKEWYVPVVDTVEIVEPPVSSGLTGLPCMMTFQPATGVIMVEWGIHSAVHVVPVPSNLTDGNIEADVTDVKVVPGFVIE